MNALVPRLYTENESYLNSCVIITNGLDKGELGDRWLSVRQAHIIN